MKKLVFVLMTAVFVLIGAKVSAQGKYGADSAECIKYLSYYKEYFKQKNYDEALPHWRKAYKLCPPTANQTMLIDGTTLLRRLISKNAKNAEYKQALIDSLLTIHDIRAKCYTKYAVTSLNNKGMDIVNYAQNNNQAVFDCLNDIIKQNGNAVTASLLLLDLKAAIELFKTEKLDAEKVINVYQSNMAILDEQLKDGKGSDMDKKIKTDMESLFIQSKVASCENLLALFTPRYQADPKNLDLVKNIVLMLSNAENCTDNDLYVNAATSMYELDPSAQAAYFLFKLYTSRGDNTKAIKYLEEAINTPGVDNASLADYNYQLASFSLRNGNYAKAYSAAEKVKELDPSMAGKAYYIMGSVWSSTSCTGDEISKRAKYWVATDLMQKAKAADSSLEADCNNLIRQFAAYFPTTADAFMYNLSDGQSYTVSCGSLRATTTVRTQK